MLPLTWEQAIKRARKKYDINGFKYFVYRGEYGWQIVRAIFRKQVGK